METRLVTYCSANFEQAFTSTDGAWVIVEFIDIFFSIFSWAFSLTNGALVFVLFIELFPIRTDRDIFTYFWRPSFVYGDATSDLSLSQF